MIYGDEFAIPVAADFNPDHASPKELSKLFRHANRISRFGRGANNSFIHDCRPFDLDGLLIYKINEHSLIEINDAFIRTAHVIRNRVADIISFQFVLSVKRSEFLGARKNVHDLGPAVIVSVVPDIETTYRLPKGGETIRHVMLHTSLSKLMQRMNEQVDDYPEWLQELLSGSFKRPRQRVLFLEESHRDLIWPCFHLPVSEPLLGRWLEAKFNELLCIGLQILKNYKQSESRQPVDHSFPDSNKIRRARTVLNLEYAHPPRLPALAQQLGISETQLKTGFKSMYSTTVLQYCIGKRVEAAKLLLREKRHSISEIADIVGYEDHSAFSRAFRRFSGRTPQEWRRAQET